MTQLATPTASVDRRERLAAYREARHKGVAWLLPQINRDGSIGDPREGFGYYRAPWTFTVVGETEAAIATSAWIRRNLVAQDGRIDGPYRVFDDWATYRDATLIVGASLAMQYDLAHGLWPGLLTVRDPKSGVFLSHRLPGGGMADQIDVTGGGPGTGFAALAVGDLETARGIARFLQRLWDVQPSLPDRFYHVWSHSRQAIITEVDADFDAALMVTDKTLDAPQFWFWGGICAAFLGRLWLADPRAETLALARRYQDFAMSATDAQFKYPAACKGSWGASLLYQITGEPQYEDYLYRMGDWYVGLQQADGWWHSLDDANRGEHIEITLEFVVHLDTLIGALASRPPSAPA